MIAAAVMVALAFGITGVVLQVVSPDQQKSPEKKKIARFAVTDLEKSEQQIVVRQGKWNSFRNRWKQFYLDPGRFWRRGLSLLERKIFQSANVILRAVFQGSLRGDTSEEDKVSVLPSSYYQQLKKRNETADENIKDLEEKIEVLKEKGTDNQEKISDLQAQIRVRKNRKDRWENSREQWEKLWRIKVFYHKARKNGFQVTGDELHHVIKKFILPGQQQEVSYKTFVQDRLQMNVVSFEKTLSEYLTILKYLSSTIQNSYLPAGIDWVTNYRGDSRNRFGQVMHSSFSRKRFQHQIRKRQSWRLEHRTRHFTHRKEVEQIKTMASEEGEGKNSLYKQLQKEKRMIGYLFIPIDKINTASREKNTSEQSSGDGESEDKKEEETSEQKAEKRRSRVMRKADSQMKKILNNHIAALETRGKKVDLKRVAQEMKDRYPVEYRESPLLTKEDLKYWMRNEIQLKKSHVQMLKDKVFDVSLSGMEKGMYLKNPLWAEEGVMLPRLTDVRKVKIKPSDSRAGLNGQGNPKSWDMFQNHYIPWSLRLKDYLQHNSIVDEAQKRMKFQWSQFVQVYRQTRNQNQQDRDVMEVVVPSEYYSGEKKKGSTETEMYGPDAAARRSVHQSSIYYRRMKEYRGAVDAFRQAAEVTGASVEKTPIFHLGKQERPDQLAQALFKKLSPSNPHRIAFTKEETPYQVGIFRMLLPPRMDGLDSFVKQRRKRRLRSIRLNNLESRVKQIVKSSKLSFEDDFVQFRR